MKTRYWDKPLRLAALATVLTLLSGHVFPAAGQDAKSATPPQAGAAQYAGADVCKTCHEDLYKKNF